MSVGRKTLIRALALGTADTAVNLATALKALDPAPTCPMAFTELIIWANAGGNVALSDNSAYVLEASGFIIPAGTSLRLASSGGQDDYINPSEIWLLSHTASQGFTVIARTDAG